MVSPTSQGYRPPVFVAFFCWTNYAPWPSCGYFWARLCPRPIFGTRRRLGKSRSLASPADEDGQPHPKGYSPPVFVAFFRWTNLAPRLSGGFFWARLCPRPIFSTRRRLVAPFRVRRTKLGIPTPKTITHPFLWPFSAGRTWRPGLRGVIFGQGCARGLLLAHGGASQSLAPFRDRRTKLASPTPKGYSPPVLVAFFRRTNLAPRPSGGYFWARLFPWPIFGTRRPLAKSRGIPSPADEVGQPHPPRL